MARKRCEGRWRLVRHLRPLIGIVRLRQPSGLPKYRLGWGRLFGSLSRRPRTRLPVFRVWWLFYFPFHLFMYLIVVIKLFASPCIGRMFRKSSAVSHRNPFHIREYALCRHLYLVSNLLQISVYARPRRPLNRCLQ